VIDGRSVLLATLPLSAPGLRAGVCCGYTVRKWHPRLQVEDRPHFWSGVGCPSTLCDRRTPRTSRHPPASDLCLPAGVCWGNAVSKSSCTLPCMFKIAIAAHFWSEAGCPPARCGRRAPHAARYPLASETRSACWGLLWEPRQPPLHVQASNCTPFLVWGLLGARGSLEKVHNSCSFKRFLRNTISGLSDPICNDK